MPKAKRKSLPGVILILALVISAAILGVYGNKLLQSPQGSGAQAPPTGRETYVETTSTPTEPPSTESTEGYHEEHLNVTRSSSSG